MVNVKVLTEPDSLGVIIKIDKENSIICRGLEKKKVLDFLNGYKPVGNIMRGHEVSFVGKYAHKFEEDLLNDVYCYMNNDELIKYIMENY